MNTVAFVVVLAALVSCICNVHALQQNLSCGGKEYSAQAAAMSNSIVAKLDGKGNDVVIDCMDYEVASVQQPHTPNYDHCVMATDRTYKFNLTMRAESTSNPSDIRYYNLADMMSVSLSTMTIHVDAASTFSIILQNPSDNPLCALKAKLRIMYRFIDSSESLSETPTLDSISPLLFSVDNSNESYFLLRHSTAEAASKASEASVTLLNKLYEPTPRGHEIMLSYHSELPPAVVTPTNSSLLSVHSASIHESGDYCLYYKRNMTDTHSKLACIAVYASNPAYYKIASDRSPDQPIHVGDNLTFTFYGSDLNTWRNGDVALLVVDTDDCYGGKPAGGVSPNTDLEPTSVLGPRVTQTMWNIVITEGGLFKVCYQKASTRKWNAVPSIEDVPNAPSQLPSDSTNDTNTTPTPTSPVNKRECPMAPENTLDAPWIKYHGIKLTLTNKAMTADILHRISDNFCVPRSALYPVRFNHTTQGEQVIYLVIDCESVYIDNKLVCVTQERYNYIVYVNEKFPVLLTRIGVASAVGLTSMVALDDDTVVIVRRHSTLALFVISLILLAAAALAVVAVQRYRENRAYFVQFGIEDDVNDMYEVGEVQGSAQATASASSVGRMSETVIEVEE